MYCSCCDNLLSFWSPDGQSEKVRCECGSSGGVHWKYKVFDDMPATHNFKFWGNAVPIRFNLNKLSDNAHNAAKGHTPILLKEYTSPIYIYTNKSEDVEIAWYEDEEEFDEFIDETPFEKDQKEKKRDEEFSRWLKECKRIDKENQITTEHPMTAQSRKHKRATWWATFSDSERKEIVGKKLGKQELQELKRKSWWDSLGEDGQKSLIESENKQITWWESLSESERQAIEDDEDDD